MLPIVLHHGLFGFGELRLGKLRLGYFRGIDRALVARGHPILISRVHPSASVETRARQLKENILAQLPAAAPRQDRVILIAHSMGGLDARYMIARLGMEDRVAALLTVCTPHHGSPYADWCVHHLGRRLRGLQLMKLLRLDVEAIVDLTSERCARFNEQIPDVPGIDYFSISAARPWQRVPPFAMFSHKIVYRAEGDNDSLVSVASARWGRHLATWPADHFHAINHRFLPEFRQPTGNITPYYLEAVDRIVRDTMPDGMEQP